MVAIKCPAVVGERLRNANGELTPLNRVVSWFDSSRRHYTAQSSNGKAPL